MKSFAPHLLGIIVLVAGVPTGAQSPTSSSPRKASTVEHAGADAADLAALRQAALDFEIAFNRGDATAIANLWTEDGDYLDEAGNVYSGRKQIEAEYQEFFAAHPGQSIKVIVDSLRLLSADAAIEDGHAILQPAPKGAPAISRYMAVHVKVDGKWLMSTVRDERVETPSAYHNVADLEWLVGAWNAEEHGAKLDSEFRWVANKSFVERSYKVTHPDQTATTGVQLIGFNPRSGQVQSWDFSSEGGHAIGLWTPFDGGWQAKVLGMTGDGTTTSAVNLLTRIDDNAYAWQSVQRTKGGVALPDTDEIVLRRSATP